MKLNCKYCKTTKNLTRHHIDGNRNNDVRENIAVLCRDCHDKVHNIKKRKWRPNKKYQAGTKRTKRK